MLQKPLCWYDDNSDGSGMFKLLNKKYYFGTAIYLMLATPIASIAVTAPYALQPRGDVDEGVLRDVKIDNEEKKK